LIVDSHDPEVRAPKASAGLCAAVGGKRIARKQKTAAARRFNRTQFVRTASPVGFLPEHWRRHCQRRNASSTEQNRQRPDNSSAKEWIHSNNHF
jgi:hypothetical protein